MIDGKMPSARLSLESHFLEAGDSGIEATGDDDDAEAGGDNEAETIPGFVDLDGEETQAGIRNSESGAGEKGSFLIIEVEQGGQHAKETHEQERAE